MSDHRYRIAIFASGSGTNAEQIIRHFADDQHIRVEMLLSNKPDAYALVRATSLGIPAATFTKEAFHDGTVENLLRGAAITHVVLAGFLWLIPPSLVSAFPGRIINIHPSLLPLFGGKGMYGMRVHQAVRAAGVDRTGITIHLVNEHYDEGDVVFQAECPVLPADTPEDIAARVHELEYAHFPRIIASWILGNKPH